MLRLRTLTESECYARLYGGRDSTVAVIRESEPEGRSGGLLGDQLRRLFEEEHGVGPPTRPEVEAA